MSTQDSLSNKEIFDLLLQLLHAERAGAKVCMQSIQEAPSDEYRQILLDIHRDESNSCAGLLNSIKIIGATADHRVGDFAKKCLIISNFNDRLQYLNRGQQWVVRKIEDAITKIHINQVQNQLREMLDVHRDNVTRIDKFLEQRTPD
jgi:nitronate monooxygenase